MSPDTPRPLSKRSVLDRAKNMGVKGDEALRDLALNQLLARIDTHAPGRFMLKGAQALRVRQVSSRATRDLDIRSDAATMAHAVDALRGALSLDLGDGILFQVTREPSPLGLDHTGDSIGVSVGIEALLQGEFIAPVSIDLVTGREPSGRVSRLPRPMVVPLPGIIEVRVATYPVQDHIADKMWATMTLFGDRPSSRPRDVYDLCAFALRSEPQALALSAALEEERVRRGLPATDRFDVPPEWPSRWTALLVTYPDPGLPRDFGEVISLIRALVEPVLSGKVTRGRWDPTDVAWVSA
jgi:hypothetical protein